MGTSTLRRKIGTLLKRTPGGNQVRFLFHRLVRCIQYLRSRNTPHARLPRTFKEARRFTDAGEFARAAEQYRRVLAVDPLHAESRWRLGEALEKLGRYEKARDEWLYLRSVPNLDVKTRSQTHSSLAQVFVRLGDLDSAADHAFRAKLVERFLDRADGIQGIPQDPEEFELLSDALNHLAEYAIVFCSDFEKAAALYERRDRVRQAYEAWLAAEPARTLYLSADWVRNIGHIACMDSWLKMQRLGWLDRDRIVLHAAEDAIANRTLVGYFEPHMKVVRDSSPASATRHLAASLGLRVSSILRAPGHPGRYFLEGVGVVQEEWERRELEPLLKLTEEDQGFGESQLRAMGVPPGAWFVCLHVRSPGFKAESKLPFSTYRDADINTYLPMIEQVTRRGGWVIRLGDPAMPPLPPMPGTIDYALGPFKGERLDIYLCAACRFFVGVASGLCHVPTAFGIPCLLTNWIANALPVYGRRDLFLLKRIWSKPLGRELTFDEWLSPSLRARLVVGTAMAEAGLQAIDNTPEELREAVIEMMDRLQGRESDDEGDACRQTQFAELAHGHGLSGFSRIGRDFLRRHRHLLADENLRRAG
jgi:putative glycosyltransferase (TIGR04372 family)